MCEDNCNCNGSCNGHCEEGGHQGCCYEQHPLQRRYQTKEKQIAELENYMKDLKLEIQAVEERLSDLRK